MFKAIISAALVFSPLAFAHEEMPAPAGDTMAPAPKEAGHGKHQGKAHHGHKPAPAPEAPAK